MRASLVFAGAVLAVGALSACGGTSIDSNGVNQEIPGTNGTCVQQGINFNESGTTKCTFSNGVILSFNDTDGVSIEGDPEQLPKECTLDKDAKWSGGQLQGGITCDWNSVASIRYTPEDGLKVVSSGPSPTA